MHWCHQCEQRIVATPQLSCPNCNSEFIEELEGDPMDIAGADVPSPTPLFQNVSFTPNPLPGRRPAALIFQQVGRPNPAVRMPLPPFPFPFPFGPAMQQTSQAGVPAVDEAGNPDLFGQIMNQITQALNGAAVNRQNANLPPGANVHPFGQ